MTALLLALVSAAAAQDALQVNPEQYAQEIDNTWVRVLRMKQAPHAKAGLHQHPATVVVYLSDVRERVTGADGKAREIAHKSGDVAYFDAGKHSEENLLDRPVETVVVELKPGVQGPPSHVTLDPVQLDPEHHLVPLENDKVRVLRTILVPKLKAPMHEHPAYVVVYLTELHTTMKMGDGREVDNPRRPGEIAWRDALKHETLNIGEKTAVEIQIELK